MIQHNKERTRGGGGSEIPTLQILSVKTELTGEARFVRKLIGNCWYISEQN